MTRHRELRSLRPHLWPSPCTDTHPNRCVLSICYGHPSQAVTTMVPQTRRMGTSAQGRRAKTCPGGQTVGIDGGCHITAPSRPAPPHRIGGPVRMRPALRVQTMRAVRRRPRQPPPTQRRQRQPDRPNDRHPPSSNQTLPTSTCPDTGSTHSKATWKGSGASESPPTGGSPSEWTESTSTT